MAFDQVKMLNKLRKAQSDLKKEIIEGSNIILKRYDENDVVESISVMNTKGHVIFLGSLRV